MFFTDRERVIYEKNMSVAYKEIIFSDKKRVIYKQKVLYRQRKYFLWMEKESFTGFSNKKSILFVLFLENSLLDKL